MVGWKKVTEDGGRGGQLRLKHSCPWLEEFIFYIKMQKQKMTQLGFVRPKRYIDIVVDERRSSTAFYTE
ncbi:unnamed protein product [Musa textilis]